MVIRYWYKNRQFVMIHANGASAIFRRHPDDAVSLMMSTERSFLQASFEAVAV